MRHASTYRAARRESVKTEAKTRKLRFLALWHMAIKASARYQPARLTGKTYRPNGKRECARRIRQGQAS